MAPDEIEELINAPATMRQQVQSIFHGTEALHKFANELVIPLIKGLLKRTDQEEAIAATYYRMVAWAGSLVELRRPIHIQAVCSAARSEFELLLDLKELIANPANTDALNAFTFVERFRAAKMLIDFHDRIYGVDPSTWVHERAFISDPANVAKYNADRLTFWGMSGNAYPKHWSKLDTFARAKNLGTAYEETYRTDYPRLSWYIHAGATGFGGISANGLEAGFGWAHSRVQEFLYEATEEVCKAIRLFEASDGLRSKLADAKRIPGKSLAYALLAAKEQAAAETTP